jgi:hypothetical protein
MANSGEFNKTVTLYSITEGTKDELGHKPKTPTLVRKCAARVWERSAAQLDNPPADFPAVALRLLLLLPPKEIAVNWQLKYATDNYEINDLEWMENETQALCTLARI